MKRKDSILGGLVTWYSRVIFFGLVFWGFLLYVRNEWMMM